MSKTVLRGEVWAVDFEPQTHRQDPRTVPSNLLKRAEEALRLLTGR